jgi:DNA invertase Pin-like site-specific DNA recombinase
MTARCVRRDNSALSSGCKSHPATAPLNAMMLDMLAAVARKDYEDRRRRQAKGIAKAKAAGAYRGRPEDTDRNAGIAGMLRSGMSWTAIQAATRRSRATVAKVRARTA